MLLIQAGEAEDWGVQMFSLLLCGIERICRGETLNKVLVLESRLFVYRKKVCAINHSACLCGENALQISL